MCGFVFLHDRSPNFPFVSLFLALGHSRKPFGNIKRQRKLPPPVRYCQQRHLDLLSLYGLPERFSTLKSHSLLQVFTAHDWSILSHQG